MPRILSTSTMHLLPMLCVVLLAGCQDTGSTAREAALQAIALRQHAVTVATNIAGRVDPRCGMLPLERRASWGAHQTNIRTVVKVWRDGEERPPSQVQEQLVHLRVDEHTNWALTEQVTFDYEGSSGVRTRELRRVDGGWFAREDGQPFVRAPFMAERGQLEVAELVEAYERIVALAGSFREDSRGILLYDEQGALRCLLPAHRRSGWLEALGRDVEVVSARATDTPDRGALSRRTASLHLVLVSDPTAHIQIDLEEFSTSARSEAVVRPKLVLSPSVGRDFWRAKALLRRATERKLFPASLQGALAQQE